MGIDDGNLSFAAFCFLLILSSIRVIERVMTLLLSINLCREKQSHRPLVRPLWLFFLSEKEYSLGGIAIQKSGGFGSGRKIRAVGAPVVVHSTQKLICRQMAFPPGGKSLVQPDRAPTVPDPKPLLLDGK